MYDTNKAPKTLEEYEILIETKLAEEAAKASEFYTPLTREQLEQEYAFLKPQEAPEISIPVEPELTLEEARKVKLSELKDAFDRAGEHAVVETPWGWPVDANREAKDDVDGIIKAMAAQNLDQWDRFCDANNEIRPVTREQMDAIMLLIIQNGGQLYDKKWQLREAINGATSIEELSRIEISFA